MKTKKCKYCKTIKPLSNFNKNKGYKDGYVNRCKNCYKRYYESRKTYHNTLVKANYEDNKEEHLERIKKYQEENKEYIKNYKTEWRLKNPNYHTEYNKSYFQNNKEKYYEYVIERKRKNPIFKFTGNIRSLIGGSFKRACNNRYKKSSKTEEILGCTLIEFVEYIQSQFEEGMNLKNHGKWELDHILPLANAQTEEDIIKLNHYTNFQPLWKVDNRKKGKN